MTIGNKPLRLGATLFASSLLLLGLSAEANAGDPEEQSRAAIEVETPELDGAPPLADDEFAYACTDAEVESAPMGDSMAPRSTAGGCGGMPDCGSYCCDFGEVCVGMNSCCADHVPYPCFSNGTCYADPNACPDNDPPPSPGTGVGGCELDKAYTFNSCATTVCGCADDCSTDAQCVSGCCSNGFCAAACVCGGGGEAAFCNGDGQVVDENLNAGGTEAGAVSCRVDPRGGGPSGWGLAALALGIGLVARRRRG